MALPYVSEEHQLRRSVIDSKLWLFSETKRKLYNMDSNPTRVRFLDHYFRFIQKSDILLEKIPIVAKYPLDLYKLYVSVKNHGGYREIARKRKWSCVVRDLELPSTITSASYTLKTQYLKLLYPYEQYCQGRLFYDVIRPMNPQSTPPKRSFQYGPHDGEDPFISQPIRPIAKRPLISERRFSDSYVNQSLAESCSTEFSGERNQGPSTSTSDHEKYERSQECHHYKDYAEKLTKLQNKTKLTSKAEGFSIGILKQTPNYLVVRMEAFGKLFEGTIYRTQSSMFENNLN